MNVIDLCFALLGGVLILTMVYFATWIALYILDEILGERKNDGDHERNGW